MPVCNLSHYSFFTVLDPASAATQLEGMLIGTGVRGTVLIAREGVNMNLAGPEEIVIPQTTEWLKSQGCDDFAFKLSFSETIPFKRLRIKAKPEIITLGIENLDVAKLKSEHISPKDFEAVLKDPGQTMILDTRNNFEYDFGTFKGAERAEMQSFRDFVKVAERLPKERPIVMFCTGGVRCEKASAYLNSLGFEQVRQLKGGILRYLKEIGPEMFEGQCFVFDERISVRDDLEDGLAGFSKS